MKLIGMLLIILCGAAIGVGRSQRLKQREKALEELVMLMRLFSNELKYTLSATDQVLAHLCTANRFSHLDFLYRCDELCRGGLPFPTAWEESVDKAEYLGEEDKKLVRSLSSVLGSTDLDGQMNALTLYENLLQERLGNAQTECRTYSKLYTTLGFLGGVLVSIVVI